MARPGRQRLTFAGYLALLAWLPLPLASNREWLWLPAAGIALLLLAAALLATPSERSRTVLRAARPALWGLSLWAGFGLIQIVPLPGLDGGQGWITGWSTISVDPYASLLALLQTLFYAALFVLTLRLVSSHHRLRITLYLLVTVGFVEAVYGSLMTLSGAEWGFLHEKTHNRGLATGTYVNRNHFAGLLEICLGLGIGLLLSQIRSRTGAGDARTRLREVVRWIMGPKMRLRIALAVMVVALVLTHSRMGNLAFFLSLLVAGGLGLVLLTKAPRPMLVLIGSLIAIDVVVIGTWFGFERVVHRIQQTGTYDESTARYRDQGRLDVDRETLQAWREHRWLGSGGGSFEVVYPAFRAQDTVASFDHAHNDYFELLLEYGMIGVLPLGVFVLTSLAAALAAQRRRRDPLMRGTGFGVTMVGVAYLLHSAVDFNLHIPANAAYLTVALGLGWIAVALPLGHGAET